MHTILKRTVNELIIKNSKFISIIQQMNDNSNIDQILADIKKEYPKATHYTYAYITENKKKASDDGEPGGTAGMPILNVLEKEGMINVVAVVVRYFGGVKLGAGGLVRAYSKSVKRTLDNAHKIELVKGIEIELNFSYEEQKNIDYLLKKYDIINKSFLENVSYTILIPESDLDFIKNIEYRIIRKILITKK